MPTANNHSLFLSLWATKFESLELRPLYSNNRWLISNTSALAKGLDACLANLYQSGGENPLTGRLKCCPHRLIGVLLLVVIYKKEVRCSPVVMQQGGQDSPHLVDILQTYLSTDKEEGKRGQTNSGSSLSPNLWFVGFQLWGKNSQCNSKLPWGLHHYMVGGSCVVLSWKASQRIHVQSKYTIKVGRTILAHTSG